MQDIILRKNVRERASHIDASIINYLATESIETYESFDNFLLISFDWYDIRKLENNPSQIIIYLDREDIFFICESENSLEAAQSLYESSESNSKTLYLFFRNLFKGKAQFLEEMEDKISALDDSVLDGSKSRTRGSIMRLKYDTLRLKKFFEPLESLFDDLCSDDSPLIDENCKKYFQVLHNRAADLTGKVQNLREYVAQVRESYQTQIGIEQNNLMKVFTLVTSIFLPLTLLVGWYGMNFDMPEFHWRFGYAGVVLVTLLVCGVWYYIFKKKNWFK